MDKKRRKLSSEKDQEKDLRNISKDDEEGTKRWQFSDESDSSSSEEDDDESDGSSSEEEEDGDIDEEVEESNNTGMNFNSLPDEAIIKIFQKLSHNDLACIARVCKQWHALTRCPLLWKKVHALFPLHHKSQLKVATLLCKTLPTCVTHIRLDFEDRNYFEDEEWRKALKFEPFCVSLGGHCPSLKALVLQGTNFTVSLQSAVDVCSHTMPNLELLSMGHNFFQCHPVKGDYCGDHSKIKILDIRNSFLGRSTKLTLSKLSSLRKLRLAATGVNDEWFQGSFLHHLQVLILPDSDISSSTLETLQTHASQLTELYLCRTKLKDSDFILSSSAFPLLKTLCLRYCIHVTCEGVLSFVRSCRSLQNVSVDWYVAEDYARHPFVVAHPSTLQIVKFTRLCQHSVDVLLEDCTY